MPPPNPGATPNAPLPPWLRVLPIVADAPLLPGMATNCFVIQAGRGALVVDPPSERAEAVEAIVKAAGGPITGILVTHTHPDHIGGVAALVARTGAAVYAHPAARAHLPSGIEQRAVTEGDEVAGWRVLHTPGHRPDSISFLGPEGVALVGDVVAGSGTVVINPPEGDLLEYLASLRRLRDEVRPALLAPGHGPLIDDPQTLLSFFIEHRLQRERQVVAALSDAPQTLADLVPRAYADTPPALYGLAERSLLAHLLKLQREGRAAEGPQGWRLSEDGK